jgi:hypothetical protein
MVSSDINTAVEIKNFIDQPGGDYYEWYVGLAENPKEKLVAHGVNLDLDRYIFQTATSIEDARNIEKYFVCRLGAEGSTYPYTGEKALSVYACKKTPSTQP